MKLYQAILLFIVCFIVVNFIVKMAVRKPNDSCPAEYTAYIDENGKPSCNLIEPTIKIPYYIDPCLKRVSTQGFQNICNTTTTVPTDVGFFWSEYKELPLAEVVQMLINAEEWKYQEAADKTRTCEDGYKFLSTQPAKLTK